MIDSTNNKEIVNNDVIVIPIPINKKKIRLQNKF